MMAAPELITDDGYYSGGYAIDDIFYPTLAPAPILVASEPVKTGFFDSVIDSIVQAVAPAPVPSPAPIYVAPEPAQTGFLDSVLESIADVVVPAPITAPAPRMIDSALATFREEPAIAAPQPVQTSNLATIIDSIIEGVTPTLIVAEAPKPYIPTNMPVFEPIKQTYIPPVPNYVIPEPIQILEPVQHPVVTYIDDAIQPPTGIIPDTIVEPAPVKTPVVDQVIDKVSDMIDTVKNGNVSSTGKQGDNSMLYLAAGVAAIGILALIFKK